MEKLNDDKIQTIILVLVFIAGLVILFYAITHPYTQEDIMSIPIKKYIAHERMIFP